MSLSRRCFFGVAGGAIVASAIPITITEAAIEPGLQEYHVSALVDCFEETQKPYQWDRMIRLMSSNKVKPETLRRHVCRRVDLAGNPYQLTLLGRTA